MGLNDATSNLKRLENYSKFELTKFPGNLHAFTMETLAMAHSSWNDEDYDNQFWPMLRETVDTLLLKPSYEPFSYEKMYSAVYKCVCKHQAERLHSDLMCHVESIVKKWSQNLFILIASMWRVDWTRVCSLNFINFLSEIWP